MGAHYFEVDSFIWLQPDDQLIPEGIQALVQLSCRRPELDADLHLALVQGLAGLQNEGHAVPPAVMKQGMSPTRCLWTKPS